MAYYASRIRFHAEIIFHRLGKQFSFVRLTQFFKLLSTSQSVGASVVCRGREYMSLERLHNQAWLHQESDCSFCFTHDKHDICVWNQRKCESLKRFLLPWDVRGRKEISKWFAQKSNETFKNPWILDEISFRSQPKFQRFLNTLAMSVDSSSPWRKIQKCLFASLCSEAGKQIRWSLDLDLISS